MEIDQENFDRLLLDVIENTCAGELVSIPGIVEILNEHYHNEVIDKWDREQEYKNENL